MFGTGVDSFFSASAYDCTILVGLAAVAAKSDDAAELKAHFSENLTGRQRCGSFAASALLLAEGTTIHYTGAWSTYERWTGSEPATGAFDTWAIGLDAHPAIDPGTPQLVVG